MDLSTQHSSQDRAAVERLLGDLTQSESNSNQPSSERPSTPILTPDAQVVHLSQLKIWELGQADEGIVLGLTSASNIY